MSEPGELRRFLVDLMPRLGKMARTGFENPGPVTYKSPGNPVTGIDKAVEAAAIEAIRATWPDHGIEGEESAAHPGSAPECWFIDPIDGTMNFVHGIPCFSVSIGVAREGKIVAGAVLDPLREELFHAALGEGAWLGERPIRIAATRTLPEATASVQTSNRGRYLTTPGLFRKLHRRMGKTRKFGTIALELAYVACGRMDLLLAGKGRPQAWWDIAGGWCLVEAAGGSVVDLDGLPLDRKSTHLVAGPGPLVEEVLAVVREFE